MTMLTDDVLALVGRSVSFTAPEELGRAAIRYFATAVGDENPLYVDPAAARAHGHEDVVAPPTLVCETNQYMTGARDEHGYLGFTWDVPVPAGSRLVRGGNAYTFTRWVRPTDRITATFTLVDAKERTSRDGRQLLVLTNEVRYTQQDGELLAVDRETLIWQAPS